MEIVIIDEKDVTSTEALHRILKDQLDFRTIMVKI